MLLLVVLLISIHIVQTIINESMLRLYLWHGKDMRKTIHGITQIKGFHVKNETR